jgi:hypothetical protein|tara:strand:+ start:21543 stop:22847 length:1305 start_codon:yes stop_codon:yes gene_type:complete
MPIGYTLLDPLIVLAGTGMALYFLATYPVRLMGWMPAALTLYFFIPFVTLMTLWQTVPMLLAGRVLLNGKLRVASSAKPIMLFFLIVFFSSSCYALVAGSDGSRAAIRVIYYTGLFALMSYSYEMARRPESYEIFLKGLVVTGAILAAYAAYQIFAVYGGLPLRGIVRGTTGVDVAYEYGVLRVNSFANEPKRLGYVLFVCGMASLFLARMWPRWKRRLKWVGYGTLFMSLFTFSGSYFLSVFLFTCIALLLYPSFATKYVVYTLPLVALVVLVGAFFPELEIFEAIQQGYVRREQEIEIGLDGTQVYRQEFYAWDYLKRYPIAAFFGVGLGQYFSTLFGEYGAGVGINAYGGLLPLNSTFLEMVFDFGGAATVMFYAAITWLILNLRKVGESYLSFALLFLTIQSFTILTIQFMVLFAGVGVARLTMYKESVL